MKKEMMKLLKNYIEKHNKILIGLELDDYLGCDTKYDKGKKNVLRDVVYDMASLLDITLNMDIRGKITIAE